MMNSRQEIDPAPFDMRLARMKNSESRWTRPELNTVGTLRDVAGGAGGTQGNGGGSAQNPS